MEFIKRFFDKRLWKFLLVGLGNTLLGMALMLIFYNKIGWGYWLSSAIAFFVASIFSFFLNKYFTFESKGKNWQTAVRFSLVIAVCYLISFSIAKPFVLFIFGKLNYTFLGIYFSMPIIEQLAMLFGQCVFTVLNYIGQRWFAFKDDKK